MGTCWPCLCCKINEPLNKLLLQSGLALPCLWNKGHMSNALVKLSDALCTGSFAGVAVCEALRRECVTNSPRKFSTWCLRIKVGSSHHKNLEGAGEIAPLVNAQRTRGQEFKSHNSHLKGLGVVACSWNSNAVESHTDQYLELAG